MKPTKKKLQRRIEALERAVAMYKEQRDHYRDRVANEHYKVQELLQAVHDLKAAAKDQKLIRDFCRERAMEHVAAIAAANSIEIDVIPLAQEIESYLRGDSAQTAMNQIANGLRGIAARLGVTAAFHDEQHVLRHYADKLDHSSQTPPTSTT